MSLLRLLRREIRQRKVNFVLALAAVTGAVAIFVWLTASANIAEDEARRRGKILGFNLLLLPKAMNLNDYWMHSPEAFNKTLPEDYVRRLAEEKHVEANHFEGKLEKVVKWRGQTILLTGVRREVPALRAAKKKQKPVGVGVVPAGSAYVGFAPAYENKLKKGDVIELLGRKFKVRRLLAQKGTWEDARVYINLKEMQEMLNLPGRVNAVEALSCICTGGVHALELLCRRLEKSFPDTQVSEPRDIAEVRRQDRFEKARWRAVVFPVVFVVSVLWIGILFFLNVRARRREIGILRAVGLGGGRIAVLFLGKALIVGLLGAALGFGLGALLTYKLGGYLYVLAKVKFKFIRELLPWSFVVAPAVALMAAALPTLHAVTLDPALALREE